MKTGFVNPFIEAAIKVLSVEAGCTVDRGTPRLETDKAVTNDLAVIVGVTGEARGLVMYNFAEITAKGIASAMFGHPIPTLDRLAESALAELANVITGSAAMNLEREGYMCTLTPPTMIQGRNTMVTMVNLLRLVIPVKTQYGPVDICIALRDCKQHPKSSD